MRLIKAISLGSLVFTIGFTPIAVLAEEKATSDEVMSKVQEAVKALKENGEKALADFHKEGKWDPKNKYAWKDTYVFVYDCKADKVLAHPTLEGKTIMDLKDKSGKLLFKEGLCKAGEQKDGGWVAYMWPKPGQTEPTQKISYALAVERTGYQASAGIYADDKTVENYKLKNK